MSKRVDVKERLPEPGKKVTVWARNKERGNTGSLPDCYIQVNDGVEFEWRYVKNYPNGDSHCSYFDHYDKGEWVPEEWIDNDSDPGELWS